MDDETKLSLPDDDQTGRSDQDPKGTQSVSRFVVGLLLLGSDELAQGLRGATQVGADPLAEEEASSDLLRHLALGLLARGQRRANRNLRAAYYASLGTASWTFNQLDRWTDNRLMRPLRRPVKARLRNWGEEAVQIIEEGKCEEQNSRTLAAEGVETIVENIFDQVAESEEVDRLIKELVGQKSVSFTASLVDNLRMLTATADGVIEGVLRRLLRRAPRRALPPSPVEGQPQTMYTSDNLVKGVDDYGG
jgi:hypothetical protein